MYFALDLSKCYLLKWRMIDYSLKFFLCSMRLKTISIDSFLIEQATVKAKQYIRTNVTNIRDECQGVELEFLCRDSPRFHEKPVENEMYAFKGFDCTEKNRAKVAHQTLFEKVNENCLKINTNPEDESKIILANVFISDACRRSGRPYSITFFILLC